MMIKSTSFGSMLTIEDEHGKILWEYLVFEREGRAHTHQTWENCYVTAGIGTIVIDDQKVKVQKGEWCHIPPGAAHWMIPLEAPFELILYYSDSKPHIAK